MPRKKRKKNRNKYRGGGSIMVPKERELKQEGGMPEAPIEEAPIEMPEASIEEAPVEEVPVDTYPNATPEEVEAAQEPDEVMENDYIDFILDEALFPEEQQYLMDTLEGDPQLSQIFDKVVETASEFSGSGEGLFPVEICESRNFPKWTHPQGFRVRRSSVSCGDL